MKKLLSAIMTIAIMMSLSIPALAAGFDDVGAEHPYKTEIEFCKDKGYVKGVSDTIFNPDGNLTRADFSVIWCRMLMMREKNHTFMDISPMTNYYDTSAIIMYSLGVINGTSPTTFSPQGNLTREQLAVITQRTFDLGEENADDYMIYTDHETISDWAIEGVNSCINAEVFTGLYPGGQNFNPQKAVTRGEICKLIYNVMQPAYTVSIGTLSGGSITATPSVARPGTTINLTITPDTGKQLKAGTLMYNGTAITGTSFVMPAEDVIITAEFEDKPEAALESITIKSGPERVSYTVGEVLDLTGLVLTAEYSDGTTKDITEGYTTDPAEGTELSTEGTEMISVSYSEGGVEKSTSFTVVVSAEEPET